MTRSPTYVHTQTDLHNACDTALCQHYVDYRPSYGTFTRTRTKSILFRQIGQRQRANIAGRCVSVPVPVPACLQPQHSHTYYAHSQGRQLRWHATSSRMQRCYARLSLHTYNISMRVCQRVHRIIHHSGSPGVNGRSSPTDRRSGLCQLVHSCQCPCI